MTDRAVYRPETGVWYILRSTNLEMMVFKWGLETGTTPAYNNDKPVPADYDGDGAADIAIYRPTNRVWYVLTSNSGYSPPYFQVPVQPGLDELARDPAPADYDGDGKTDFAVNHSSYWIYYSSLTQSAVELRSENTTQGFLVPADYNGDGKDDPANVYVQFDVVYRWKFTVDQNHETTITRWGNGRNNDQPVPDDYDGDGITDIAVYRNGQWWVKESSTQETRVFVFGRTFGYDYPAQFSVLQSFY